MFVYQQIPSLFQSFENIEKIALQASDSIDMWITVFYLVCLELLIWTTIFLSWDHVLVCNRSRTSEQCWCSGVRDDVWVYYIQLDCIYYVIPLYTWILHTSSVPNMIFTLHQTLASCKDTIIDYFNHSVHEKSFWVELAKLFVDSLWHFVFDWWVHKKWLVSAAIIVSIASYYCQIIDRFEAGCHY